MLGKFINHREDSLTAAVFTHLLHLPVELFWQILRNACYTATLPEDPGELLQVNPWPAWNPRGTNNTQRVIPDLFLRFGNLDLIIEAKRWDDWMQDHPRLHQFAFFREPPIIARRRSAFSCRKEVSCTVTRDLLDF